MKLTEMLLQMSYDLHYSPVDWAEKLKVSKEEVSDYFIGKKELPFVPFLKLVRINYPDYQMQNEILTAYFETVKTAPNILYSMELLSQMKESEQLEKLIERGLGSDDPIVREWADLYTLSLNQDTLFEDDFLYPTKKATLKCEVMKFMLEIMRVEILLKLNANVSIDKVLDELHPQLHIIKNEFLRYSFEMRLHKSTLYSSLRLNLVGKVRKVGEQILNDPKAKGCFPIQYAHIIHAYGLSFLYENPNKALELLNNVCEQLRKFNSEGSKHYIEETEKTKAFIRNVWGIDQPEPSDIPEKIHYFLGKGEKEKAQFLLIELKKKQPLTEFQDYYWGLAFEDEKALQRSYERFRSSGNFFFAILPVRALSKISLERLKENQSKPT